MTRSPFPQEPNFLFKFLFLILLATSILFQGCSAQSQKGAGTGAAIGGLSGVVGGMVSALVFGGNIGEAAAKGAVWGASTGAVSGAIAGAHQNALEKKEINEKRTEELQKTLGEDAFNSLSALSECKHDIALGYARTAAQSSKQHESLAGIWLEILTLIDRGEPGQAKALYPKLIEADKRIESIARAEELTNQTYAQLKSLRTDYGFSASCK